MGTIPCFGLGAQITPPPLIYYFFLKQGGRLFSFFLLILAPAGGSNPRGSNQTSFLPQLRILNGCSTLWAPFLALRGKKPLSTRDYLLRTDEPNYRKAWFS